MSGWGYAPPQEPLVVVHVDRDLVVIDKPAGLLSVPGRGPDLEDSALRRVQARYPGAFAVHRLDMDTSGLLVFATRRRAERALLAQFRERQVKKRYLAWVSGTVHEASGCIELPLSRVPGQPRSVVDPIAGKAASTSFSVMIRQDGASLLALSPHTGRSHQLRVHLMALGHPILGDRFYAEGPARAAADRLLLHAEALELAHPYGGQLLRFAAETPFSCSAPPRPVGAG